MKLATLHDAILYFSDPVRCREYLVAQRWPDGVICPKCGSKDVLFLEKYERWHCRAKHEAPQFTLKTGTVMEDSAIRLEKWLPAFWLLANCKNGISSYELHRALGVTQKSAWFMLQRIRLALSNEPSPKLGGGFAPVEADETFIGGKIKNMHKSKRPKGSGFSGKMSGGQGKAIVVGMLERGGRVKAEVVYERTQAVLHELVKKHLEPSSSLVTDEWGGYRGLSEEFLHVFVNHAVEYVNGHIHTQGIENFWSLLKRGLTGTYISVEPFHLHRYLAEQIFRYDNRATKDNPLTDLDRFTLAVSQIVGKRLTYAELTGKVGETSAEPF